MFDDETFDGHELSSVSDSASCDRSRKTTIPAGLDEMEPGPELAAVLASVADEELSGHDRVVVLRAHQRMVSHYQARLYADMAAITDAYTEEIGDDPESAFEAATAEVRAALRLTRRAADTELGLALDLCERIPRAWQALAAGNLDLRRTRILIDGTAHLPAATAQAVVDRLIDRAPGSTTGQLTARLRRTCIEADPADATRRYHHATDQRKITTEATEAGTAHLHAWNLPPERVAAATRRINTLARTLHTADQTRSLDQLRADVLIDLLEGTANHPTGQGTVDITVDLTTLTELSESPGDLAGYGPVIADIARHIVDQSTGQWRWTLTHPDTHAILDTGTTRRRPTTHQRRHVQATNPTCVFPGCRMPATGCDLDHRTPWAEDPKTVADNLVPLCRHDHRIRHQHNWTHQPLPNGDHQWTTPLGHTHTTSGQPP